MLNKHSKFSLTSRYCQPYLTTFVYIHALRTIIKKLILFQPKPGQCNVTQEPTTQGHLGQVWNAKRTSKLLGHDRRFKHFLLYLHYLLALPLITVFASIFQAVIFQPRNTSLSLFCIWLQLEGWVMNQIKCCTSSCICHIHSLWLTAKQGESCSDTLYLSKSTVSCNFCTTILPSPDIKEPVSHIFFLAAGIAEELPFPFTPTYLFPLPWPLLLLDFLTWLILGM